MVSPEAFCGQIAVISGFQGSGGTHLPVLVASGAHEVVIHAYATYAMSPRLPDAKVVLYSDAGHGFLHQRLENFARKVNEFLGR